MEEALTHSSVTKKCCKQLELLGLKESEYLEYMNGCSYERLEFVGDAVLGHLITVYLYGTYPGIKPGILTRLRSENIKNETLARVAVKHGFFNYLRFEFPDLPDMIEKFIQAVENESKPHLSDHSKAPKILADMVEPIVGVVFVDSGNSAKKVWEVFEPLLQPLVGPETLEMHPVAELQEICQSSEENEKEDPNVGIEGKRKSHKLAACYESGTKEEKHAAIETEEDIEECDGGNKNFEKSDKEDTSIGDVGVGDYTGILATIGPPLNS
ncbi:ribonuclease 3-like protein 3 [Cryptomeria japonica]|uniref:ribonuclease 3-like protein 3 n=1 Tax=Cryptomeria japonica TaxID=3369 RepID=UPI0027DA6770|nr:ribonuclease 3-like protein 3 [Cryptomeria japonica]